jgi:hypothetical protein
MVGRRLREQDGGMVLGWLLRVSAALVLMGVLAFDVFSLAYTNVTAVDDAEIVATQGALALIESPRDVKAARAVSQRQAEELGVALRGKDWWIDEDGEVHVTVTREARSVVLHYVPQLRRYLTVHAVGTAATH